MRKQTKIAAVVSAAALTSGIATTRTAMYTQILSAPAMEKNTMLVMTVQSLPPAG